MQNELQIKDQSGNSDNRVLTAVYLLICNYFKNISKKVCVCKNKSYLYTIIINK